MIGVKPDGRRLADIGKIIDDGQSPAHRSGGFFHLSRPKRHWNSSRSRHVAGRIVLTL
jgi:hypothetical protein